MPHKTIIIPIVYILLFVLSLYTPVHAAHLHKEREYRECWCDKAEGITEYVLPDKTRVDPILFGTEFDEVVQQIRHREIIVLIGNENTSGY